MHPATKVVAGGPEGGVNHEFLYEPYAKILPDVILSIFLQIVLKTRIELKTRYPTVDFKYWERVSRLIPKALETYAFFSPASNRLFNSSACSFVRAFFRPR